MASVEESIYSRLSTFAGLTALVSTRIYPLRLPQNPTYPAITFFRVTAAREPLMGDDAGVVRARVQVSCWSKGGEDADSRDEPYEDIDAVSTQVNAALRRLRGAVASLVIQDVFLLTENDLLEDDPHVIQRAMDFEVIFEGT